LKDTRFGVCRGGFNETHSTWIIFQSPSLSDQFGNPVETRDPFELLVVPAFAELNFSSNRKTLSRCAGNREDVQWTHD
jgi:hypothetical protein